MDQPHRAARVEERIHALVERRLHAQGWTPRVVPYVGYGGSGWVRVLARVLLMPPGSPRSVRTDGRGWRRFVSASASGVPVTVTVGGHTHVVPSTRDGYVDVRLEVADALEPGWTHALLSVADAEPVEAPLRIVGPATTLGLLSDVDDTVIVTMLPRPLVAFRNAFLVREIDRRPVPGMAALYADVAAAHPDVLVVYLSTGAWNTAAALNGFLARHGYPPGPLLLTDWGPTDDGWFRSGPDHKRAQLAHLFADFPGLRWLLVGDDGQHDPSLYAEAAAAFPDQVLAIAIRQLSVTEQLAQHGSLVGPDPTTEPAADTGAERRTPQVWAPDGQALAAALRVHGILPPAGQRPT
ncbi:MAG: phosphatase domain-containing protein [Nocardioides sp.]|jgi:phosphatidate phosphatase APP1